MNPPASELHAINLALSIIITLPRIFCDLPLLIVTDSYACLSALASGPLHQFHVKGTNYSITWQLLLQAAHVCSRILLHYTPAHVGIEPNKKADAAAKRALSLYPREFQHHVQPTLPLLKPYLAHCFREHWTRSLQLHDTHRRSFLGSSFSKLTLRCSLPRPFQTLYSRWRLGCIESCGTYAKALHFTNASSCRFCSSTTESPHHLLTDCPGTYLYRDVNHLSIEDLATESPSSMMKIVRFDRWLRHTLPYVMTPPDFGVGNVTL